MTHLGKQSVFKGLSFFRDDIRKKWPLRGSKHADKLMSLIIGVLAANISEAKKPPKDPPPPPDPPVLYDIVLLGLDDQPRDVTSNGVVVGYVGPWETAEAFVYLAFAGGQKMFDLTSLVLINFDLGDVVVTTASRITEVPDSNRAWVVGELSNGLGYVLLLDTTGNDPIVLYFQPLGEEGDVTRVRPKDVSNDGTVVGAGSLWMVPEGLQMAQILTGTPMGWGSATGIDDDGRTVVGRILSDQGDSSVFRYDVDTGVTTDLSANTHRSMGQIDVAGEIVMAPIRGKRSVFYPYRHMDGEWEQLPGSSKGFPADINSAGQIIGSIGPERFQHDPYRAFVFGLDGYWSLDDLVDVPADDPWLDGDNDVYGVSDPTDTGYGLIVGKGGYGAGVFFDGVGFVLVPVSVP